MKKALLLLAGWLAFSGPALAASQEVLEIDISGMTCSFCVYGVEKNLGKLPGVDNVEVSLEANKARVIMEPGESADEDSIRECILDAGFTPGEARRYTKDT
jgi:copper chaperone CopZ